MSRTFSAEQPSRVVFELEQQGDQVKLTVTHDDFAEDSKVFGSISNGWPLVLSSLKSYLEANRVCSRRGTTKPRRGGGGVMSRPAVQAADGLRHLHRRPTEKVWQALTDPAFSRQYFFGFAVDVEPKAGGAFFLRSGRPRTRQRQGGGVGRRRAASPARGGSKA